MAENQHCFINKIATVWMLLCIQHYPVKLALTCAVFGTKPYVLIYYSFSPVSALETLTGNEFIRLMQDKFPCSFVTGYSKRWHV